MHPLIAWLSFIFSPSDDWLLKRAYEMMLEPTEIRITVDSYDEMSQRYPTYSKDGNKITRSADTPFMAVWADILDENKDPKSAQHTREGLTKNKATDENSKNDFYLQLAEQAMADGDTDMAEKTLAKITETQTVQQVDAVTDRLFCRLLKEEIPTAEAAALSQWDKAALPHRSQFALGLSALQMNQFEKALAYLPQDMDNNASLYFRGLAYLKSGKPLIAIPLWQRLHQKDPASDWAQMAFFQMGEAYFAVGDNRLCRVVCEKNLQEYPEGLNKDRALFRLASLDFKDKNYAGALAYLEKAELPDDLSTRGTILLAQSLAQTDQTKELYARLTEKKHFKETAENTYQRSWVMAFANHYEESYNEAQQGLETFNEQRITPQLLLLQGLVLEHLNREADALATYQVIVDHFAEAPEAAKSINFISMAYMRSGRAEELVTHIPYLWAKLPEKIQSKYPDPLYWLGEAHAKLKRWEDAEQSFSRFAALAAFDHELKPYAEFQIASAQIKQKKSNEAIAHLGLFQKYAELNKKGEWVSLAHLQKGHLQFHDGNFREAVAEYRAIHNPKAQYYEALALAKMEYFSDAVVVWKKLAAEIPSNQFAMNGLFRAARMEFELGRSTDAVATYALFIQTYPDNLQVKEARLQSAHALYNSGNVAAALPLYQDYLARYKTSEDLAMVTPYLASCYAQAGKSLDEMETGLKGLPPTEVLADARWEYAAKKFNEKEFAAASTAFTHLLTDTPAHKNSSPSVFYLGETSFQKEDWMAATGAYHNFVAQATSDKSDLISTAHFHSGVAFFNQDKLLAAATQFQTILDKTPNATLAKDAKENLYLCYRNLGDWVTMNKLKEKYGDVSHNEHMDVSSAAGLTNLPQ